MPVWEFGLGAGVLAGNDYRGSSNSSAYVGPVPYFVYRGENLRFDQDGLRGTFMEQDNLRLNLSLSGSLPADSDENSRRQGMSDLKPTLEIGPQLEVTLDQREFSRLRLILPVRGVIATNLKETEAVGWVFSPQLTLDTPQTYQRWEGSLKIGPMFANDKYHQYFYGVDPEYATMDRPAYDAEGGYSGSAVQLSIARRRPGWWFGAFIRYDYLGGAVFDNSPLVEQNYALMSGIALTWNFTRSSKSTGKTQVWR
jgi:outer membrane scaffolding protein for murein synthesis (MipA/OmpV family)